MWEEYELTFNNAKALRNEEYDNLTEMKKSITQIKEDIRKLGDVNVNALEEYKEISERYGFLKGQHDDLIEAEQTLLGIIEDLDTGMKRQFAEKFADIQREFDKAFKELFGGGKGTLELVEEEEWNPYHCTAAGQKTAEYDAAFRRRKILNGNCTVICDPESETIPVLSLRRD